MKYLVRKKGPGKYWVNQPGSKKSYTNKRENARQFDSYDEALADYCGNEYPEKF